jgi:hypothetical protein
MLRRVLLLIAAGLIAPSAVPGQTQANRKGDMRSAIRKPLAEHILGHRSE